MAVHTRLQAGQLVGVVQKVRGLHTVVLHQAQQGGTVAQPVVAAQRCGIGFVQPQFALDEGIHAGVDATKGGGAGVVQGVVQIEQPDALWLWHQWERIMVPYA